MCAIFSPGVIGNGVESFCWGKKEPYSLWRNILCRLLIRKRQFRKKKAVLHGGDRTRGARLANMLFSGAGVPLIGMFQGAAPFFDGEEMPYLSDIEKRLERDSIPRVLFPFLIKRIRTLSQKTFERCYPSFTESPIVQSADLNIYDIKNEDTTFIGIFGEYARFANDLINIVNHCPKIQIAKYKFIIGFMKSRNPVGFVLDVYIPKEDSTLCRLTPTFFWDHNDILLSFKEAE